MGSDHNPAACDRVVKGKAVPGMDMSNAAITAGAATGNQPPLANEADTYALKVENKALPCVLQTTMNEDGTTCSRGRETITCSTAADSPMTPAKVVEMQKEDTMLSEIFAEATPDQLRTASSQLASALIAVRVALTDVADYKQETFILAHTGGNEAPESLDSLDALHQTLQLVQSTLSDLKYAISNRKI